MVSFSLLFGTTWFVNALTFFAILSSVLLAILINWKFPIRRPTFFYIALFVSIAVAYLLPPESLLFDPIWLRYVVAAAVAFAPVFFANLVFSYSFRDTTIADMAFASNLLGAMVGGALEYLALITGYRSLLLVVALAVRAGVAVRHARAAAVRPRARRAGDPKSGRGGNPLLRGRSDRLDARHGRAVDRQVDAAIAGRASGPQRESWRSRRCR